MDKFAGTFKFIENWEIIRKDNSTGEIIDKLDICNTIVNDGLEVMAKRIGGDAEAYFRALAIGTGTTSVTNSDTALETEYTRATATTSEYEASYKWTFSKTFTFGTGVSEDITEAGIFDSATATGSTMLARTVFSAKTVNASIDLIVNATISVARV